MVLTYATYPLACPDASAKQWLADHFKLCDVLEFAALTWPGYARQKWAGWTSAHLRDSLRPIKVNSLWWPNGASRFATFHGLLDSTQLALIRTATSNGASAATLKMNDGIDGHEITPSLFMLPPRPLGDCPGVPSTLSSLFLLTLVDARFFFWFKSADITVTGGTTTWANLLTSIDSALGTSTSVGPYTTLKPSENLTSHYEYLPLLLDAVAHNTGGRVVRSLAGAVTIQAPDDAKTSQDAQLEDWPKEAGGLFYLDPTAVAANRDFGVMVPATVRVTFGKVTTSGERLDGVYSETKTLASLSLTSYYGAYTGKAGDVKLYTDDAYAIYDDELDGTPNNASDLQTLATAMATAFYKFMAGRQSTRFGGIVPYTPEALSDSIEWVYEAGNCYTLVQRGPWNDLADRLNHYTADDPVECCPEYWCVADTTTAASGHYDGKYYRWDDATNALEEVGDCWIKMLNGTAPVLSTYYVCSIEDLVTISSSERRRAVVAEVDGTIVGEEDNATIVNPMRYLNVLKTTGLYLDDAGSQQGNLGMFNFTSNDGTVAITYNSATQTIDFSALCCAQSGSKWWCVLMPEGSGSGPGGSDCPCDTDDMAVTIADHFITALNGTHTLTYGGQPGGAGPCFWEGSVTSGGDTYLLLLFPDETSGTWIFTLTDSISGTANGSWRLAQSSWTCCDTNVLDYTAGIGPPTVSISQTCSGSGSGSGDGVGFVTRCVYGTPTEAAAAGTVVNGPYDDYATCAASCESGGSGSGGSGGSSPGTACCAEGVPASLQLVLTKVSGDDNYNFPASILMTYVEAAERWYSDECYVDSEHGCSIRFVLRCLSGVWALEDQSVSFEINLTEDSCDPFHLTGDNQNIFGRANTSCDIGGGACSAFNGVYDIDITEAP